jgi:uncharacterized protein (DUF169 family)
MTDYKQIETRITRSLGLTRRPVAVAFRDAAPPGVAKFEGSTPSGCTFWRLAVTGAPFYTVPADHFNCPIGSHTHNIPLPAAREAELGQTLTFMTGIGYLRMEEVPGIPRLPHTPGAIVYAALGETPVDPDVVLFVGKPGRVMLLQESAIRAGVAAQVPMFGRPTCMALPAAMASGTIASTSCVGNRVYTDLGDDELYVAVPGRDLERLAAEVDTIAEANARLTDYHRGRRQALATQ